MPPTVEPDPDQRARAAANAIASLALDGLRPDDQTRQLLQDAVRGELTADQVHARALQRARQP